MVFTLSARAPEEVTHCRSKLESYMSGLIKLRRRQPCEDILSALLAGSQNFFQK